MHSYLLLFCWVIIVFPSFYLWPLLLVHIAWYLPVKAAMPSFIIIDENGPVNMSGGLINAVVTGVKKL